MKVNKKQKNKNKKKTTNKQTNKRKKSKIISTCETCFKKTSGY